MKDLMEALLCPMNTCLPILICIVSSYLFSIIDLITFGCIKFLAKNFVPNYFSLRFSSKDTVVIKFCVLSWSNNSKLLIIKSDFLLSTLSVDSPVLILNLVVCA